MSYYRGNGGSVPRNGHGHERQALPAAGFQQRHIQTRGYSGTGNSEEEEFEDVAGPGGYHGVGPQQPTVHVAPIVNQMPQPSQTSSSPPLATSDFQKSAKTEVLQRDPDVERDPEVVDLLAQLSAKLQEEERDDREEAALKKEMKEYNESIKANLDQVAKLRRTTDLGRAIADRDQKIASAVKQIAVDKRINSILERDIISEVNGTAPPAVELSRIRKDYQARLDQHNRLKKELHERLLPAQKYKNLILIEFGSDVQRAMLQQIQTKAAKLKPAKRSVGTQEPEIMDID